MSGGPAPSQVRICKIVGALIEARPAREAALYELALVGERGMLAEVIRLDGDAATLQVYENTNGLRLGEPVRLTRQTLTAQLGPGLTGSVLDGTGRPLERLSAATGDFLAPGVQAPTLDATRSWAFEATAHAGDRVHGGDVLGTVQERPGLVHRVLVPPTLSGTIATLDSGTFSVEEPIGALEDGALLHLAHRWPVRLPRPFTRRLPGSRPFITGQRVFDLLFPIAEGGSAVAPGGFGTGKTIIEHSLAKFADADVVVFVGCGERGNEMTELLHEFPRLIDPRTGRSIMDRAVLIVNTSNMPVAAREASIYLGATVAEYYRDMGYRAALMVDSISRWAEALREMAARLQEMPGEEGFPPYLASRLGHFCERAGRVQPLGTPEREGALTIISAVSPPGGDFSEPVTQAAQRVTGALWGLDASLAHQRHFPAVDWSTSYSLYGDACASWFAEHVAPDWAELRRAILGLLERERELREVTALVGPDALEPGDHVTMEVARMAREFVLRQNAFHPNDASSSPARTYALAATVRQVHAAAVAAVGTGSAMEQLSFEPVRRALVRLRDASLEDMEAAATEARAAASALAPAASATRVRAAEQVPVPAGSSP